MNKLNYSLCCAWHLAIGVGLLGSLSLVAEMIPLNTNSVDSNLTPMATPKPNYPQMPQMCNGKLCNGCDEVCIDNKCVKTGWVKCAGGPSRGLCVSRKEECNCDPFGPTANPNRDKNAPACRPCTEECRQVLENDEPIWKCVPQKTVICPDGTCANSKAQCPSSVECDPPCKECSEMCLNGTCTISGKTFCEIEGKNKCVPAIPIVKCPPSSCLKENKDGTTTDQKCDICTEQCALFGEGCKPSQYQRCPNGDCIHKTEVCKPKLPPIIKVLDGPPPTESPF